MHKISKLLNSLCEYLIQFSFGNRQITIMSNIPGIPNSGHILANFMVIYTYRVDSSHSINDLEVVYLLCMMCNAPYVGTLK